MASVLGALKQAAGSVPVVIKAGPNKGCRWSITTTGRGYGNGTFESGRMNLLCGLLQSGECFWDIGAHKGYVSLLASRLVGPEGRVYAFEPSAENRGFLERHIRWNGADNVTVIPVAVAGRDGRERFGGRSSVAFHLGEGRETVDVRSVPSLLRNDGLVPPQFIKIDAEGMEARILEGAGDGLFDPNKAVLVSTHSFELFETCSEILNRSGFRVIESGAIENLRRQNWTWRSDPDILAIGPKRSVSEDVLRAFELS